MSESSTIALVRDLLFVSKITVAASAAGAVVRIVRDPARLAGVAGNFLLVDLNVPGAIAAAAAWRAATGGRAVGFVSHVDVATAGEARVAGIDQVLARSRFVEVLPVILSEAKDLRSANGPDSSLRSE